MASMILSLPDPLRDWIEKRIASGEYATVDDYVRDLIGRDQAAADDRDALVAALIEGEESGVSPRTVTDILAALRLEWHGAGG